MKQQKRHFAVICAAMLLVSVCTGCGSSEDSGGAVTTAAAGSAASSETTGATGTASQTTGKTDTAGTTAAAETKSGANTETTQAGSNTAETSAATTAAGDDKPSGGDSAETTAAGGSNDEKPAETTKQQDDGGSAQTTAANNTNASADDPDDNPDEVIKYIYLKGNTAQYAGEGIFVSGSKITISAGGSYEISGTLDDGQIVVQTDKKKVKLLLNNAKITNKSGAAISCLKAKKMTIKTLADTTSYLEDGGTHDEDKGVIFSENTVQLSGEGTLNIKANFAHGVQSDDDIRVNSGRVNITATKSCLHSNDGIEINGGYLYCDGGTNGIKTDGYITITGGSSVFMGGEREEKGAIYCDGVFAVKDGEFWAIGNTFTKPDAAVTESNVLGIVFPNIQTGGTCVNVTRGSNEVFTMTSPRQFKYVVYSGPNLLKNAEYSVSYGGTVSDKSKTVCTGQGYSGGTDGGKFTAGETITFYTVQ
ncbi:MAG: carbohydrate-binding domain-containing protein [Oscillospiraceae bacterium]|nr:carbohydrate-binding domain-containing protein [Oscillospiraceae bacterium]